MCTTIVKIVKEVPAIPFNSVNIVQNPCGIYITLNIVLQSSMTESKLTVLMPADWIGQFFPRKYVYQKASQATAASNVSQGSFRHWLTSAILTLGPLHVDLNADEDIVAAFMRLVYESVFPGRATLFISKIFNCTLLFEAGI